MPGTIPVATTPADPALLDELADVLGAERARRWRIDRTGYRPEIALARTADGRPAAAALTSARPATAAVKIVDLWQADAGASEATDAVLDAVVAAARARGDVAVKWEAVAPLPQVAARRGFAPLRRPWAAVGTEHVDGYVLWLGELPHTEPGYYAQTTLFTCGAVAALLAADARGAVAFSGAAEDRDVELGFWRRASNFPACEPVGLGVALAETLGSGVEVALDLEGPALLEGYQGFERDFRAELQEHSARRAAELGVPLRRDRVAVDEIARRVAGGAQALLLIDEAPMHGETGPHWVLAHAAAHDVVLVQDPWISVEAGETWVDTHDLPVRLADLDRMVAWGPDGYRGVIFAG